MKSIDLVVVGGSKASQKAVLPLTTGKNTVGNDKDCNCSLSWKLVQPKHFELLVTKSGDITLIPQVDGMQLQMPNGKMKELDAFSCYSLALNRRFYIDRSIGFSFEKNSNKKQKDAKNMNKKGSVWSPIQSDDEVESKKKQKKQQESEDEEEVEEVTPVKKAVSKKQSKVNGKTEKTKKKQAKEIIPVDTDEEDDEEEQEDEEGSEIEEEKEESPKRKSTRSKATSVIKSSENNQKKGKKNESQQSSERKHCAKAENKIILSNCELTPAQKSAMEKLGAIFTDDIQDNFYIVLMDKFKRRAKLLVGLNSGAKIISKDWVKDCIYEGDLIPQLDQYYLQISETDSKQFSGLDLDKIQESAKKRKPYSLFAKYCFILPDDDVNNSDLIAIIESGNGIIVTDEDQVSKSKTLVQLMSKENYKKNKAKLSKSIKYADPEFVLLSSLKQDIQEQLFFN